MNLLANRSYGLLEIGGLLKFCNDILADRNIYRLGSFEHAADNSLGDFVVRSIFLGSFS
ncbi:hypothetical protein D3C81_2065480 [compost metagenome]